MNIFASDEASAERAMQMVSDIAAVAEVGKTYLGKVVRLVDFGAFVEIFPGTDGLLHISEIAENRVKEVRDELKEGDQIMVKVLALEGNKIKLSRKAVLKEQREKLKKEQPTSRKSSKLTSSQGRVVERRARPFVILAASRVLSFHPRQNAAHIREAFLHARQRIIRVDLVLEHHSALVAHPLQLPEDRRDRQNAVAYRHLTILIHRVRQIFHVHVVESRTRIFDRLDDVGAGARGVADVDAQAHPLIHALSRPSTHRTGQGSACPQDRGCESRP